MHRGGGGGQKTTTTISSLSQRRQLLRQMGLFGIVVAALLLCLCPSLVQARIHNPPQRLRRSLVLDAEPHRVPTPRFFVKLAPTPLTLDGKLLNEFYVILQEFLRETINDETGNGLPLLYFVMTDISPEETEGNVSTLSVGEGAATFGPVTRNGNNDNIPLPKQEQIEAWLRTAIDTRLVDKLQDTDFYYVQEARFVSAAESASNRGPNNSIVDEVAGVTPSTAKNGNSRADAALRASVIMAGVAIILLGALLVRSHRQRQREMPPTVVLENDTCASQAPQQQPRIESIPSEPDTIPVVAATPIRNTSSSPEEEVASSPPRTPSDARSLADSESSWTVATEMGDSAALHSVATHPSQAIVSTESFEHDRQVYLQKDMLTTAWSGNNANGGPVLSESVLQPSHFSASQGHRRSWVDTDESPRPFIFASHDADAEMGEEVFLMPEEKGHEDDDMS